jgi:hypothetical protein
MESQQSSTSFNPHVPFFLFLEGMEVVTQRDGMTYRFAQTTFTDDHDGEMEALPYRFTMDLVGQVGNWQKQHTKVVIDHQLTGMRSGAKKNKNND